jgi:ABC-type hemin transport system ATPase subunit
MKPGLVLCLLLVAVGLGKAETVSFLDGKLKLDTGEAFIQEKEAKAEKKSELAHFAARDSDESCLLILHALVIAGAMSHHMKQLLS